MRVGRSVWFQPEFNSRSNFVNAPRVMGIPLELVSLHIAPSEESLRLLILLVGVTPGPCAEVVACWSWANNEKSTIHDRTPTNASTTIRFFVLGIELVPKMVVLAIRLYILLNWTAAAREILNSVTAPPSIPSCVCSFRAASFFPFRANICSRTSFKLNHFPLKISLSDVNEVQYSLASSVSFRSTIVLHNSARVYHKLFLYDFPFARPTSRLHIYSFYFCDQSHTRLFLGPAGVLYVHFTNDCSWE